MTWLVVGLGNPGPKYCGTRHNIGFAVIDELAKRASGAFRTRFQAETTTLELGALRLQLLKPQTFMNASGRSVRPASDFFKVPIERLVVVHDELDLPFGAVKLKRAGGEAGHRGLRSVTQELGSNAYFRVRVGIGRPPAEFSGTVADFVLEPFAPAEVAELDTLISSSAKAVETLVQSGPEAAMNEINSLAHR